MEKQDNILKELESITPKLADIPKKDVFNVPNGYFSKLPETVQQRIHTDQQNNNVVRGHVFGPKALKWVAASIAIVLFASGYYYIAWNSFYDNIKVTEAYVLENVDEEIFSDYFAALAVKNTKMKENIDNSLEEIDEEILIEGL
jgi:hypothetical protein